MGVASNVISSVVGWNSDKDTKRNTNSIMFQNSYEKQRKTLSEIDAAISTFGASILGTALGVGNIMEKITSNSVDQNKKVTYEYFNNEVYGSLYDSNSDVYAWEDADKYINSRFFGYNTGAKVYFSNEIASLPKKITSELGGYTYTWVLDEYANPYIYGVEVQPLDMTNNDGVTVSTRRYGYNLVYTDEPQPNQELLIGMVPFLPSGIKGGVKEYKSPTGGGGVTAQIKVGETNISFGHGGRHLEGTGLSIDEVNSAIAQEIANIHPGTGNFYKGQIEINGQNIEYTSYGTMDNEIKIGTYYPK